MGEGRTSGKPSGNKVSAYDAAAALGITVDAVRKRIARGTIPHERDEHGRVWVVLDDTSHVRDTDRDEYQPQPAPDALISAKDELIATLQEQLQAERQAHSEARRLLAAALERIPPAIEAPTGPRGWPERDEAGEDNNSVPPHQDTATSQRPWWRRWVGG